MLLDLHFVFMDFLLWSCLEFCCHVYLDDVYASDKVTNAGNTFMSEIKFKRSRFSRVLDHWISFSFFVFYLKVYLNMSRLSTVCVKRHPTGDKNRVCESLSTSGRVWHHTNSIIYARPSALYGRLTLTMENHRIVYPWDVFLRYKRR